MTAFWFALLVIICVVSSLDVEDCEFGYFGYLSTRYPCAFHCNNKDSEWLTVDKVSYELIYEACENIRKVASEGICDTLDDLVFRSDECTCPYCKCNGTESDPDIFYETLSYEKSWLKLPLSAQPSETLSSQLGGPDANARCAKCECARDEYGTLRADCDTDNADRYPIGTNSCP